MGNSPIQAARMREIPEAVMDKVLAGVHDHHFNLIVLRGLSQAEKSELIGYFTQQGPDDRPIVTGGGIWSAMLGLSLILSNGIDSQ